VTCDVVRRSYIGESWFLTHRESQKWHFLSDQQPHEVTMLKIYDSDTNVDAKCTSAPKDNLDPASPGVLIIASLSTLLVHRTREGTQLHPREY
jgi:hypothetical protein